MQLTEPVRLLFESTQPLLKDIPREQQTVLETHDVIHGPIRISLAGKFVEDHLVPMLTLLCTEHPPLELDVDFCARNEQIMDGTRFCRLFPVLCPLFPDVVPNLQRTN